MRKSITLRLIAVFCVASLPCAAQPSQPVAVTSSIQQKPTIEQLYLYWRGYCSSFPINTTDGYLHNPPFNKFVTQGGPTVEYLVGQIKQGEIFAFMPVGTTAVMSVAAKTTFHYEPVPYPQNPKLTVMRVQEFPDMLIGKEYGDVEKVWLIWWAERKQNTPAWFSERYRNWKAQQASHDAASDQVNQSFIDVEDIGVPALPLWIGKLYTDPTQKSSIIKAISYLTSGEVAANATPAQVKQWWKANKTKWSLL